MALPRRLSYDLDPDFLDETMLDIREHIEALSKSRAKQPKDRQALVMTLGPRGYRRILVTISVPS